ncbi:MAG: nitrogenase component 1 [Elusimicrobiales bacterium]|nr:nitrogenase component 1 [Elusimicrobiales bacterium]
MSDTAADKAFERTYQLPYQLGVFMAVNAVRDVCLVVDAPNCAMVKADLIAGNHDLFSTLLSPSGRHRVVCTMVTPFTPQKNPEKRVSAILNSISGSGGFGAVLLTGLPFGWLAGMDYDGIAAAVPPGTPVSAVPAKSMDLDWLEGYDLSLEALARCVRFPKKTRRASNKVALAGYLLDRNEFDHAANLKEISRLLELAGLDLVSVWPSGGPVADLERAAEASLVISLPYGRRAARTLAARCGAKLLETGLPMGLKGTSAWLERVRRAAGLKGALPAALVEAERSAAAALTPALRVLRNRNVLFAGDPHLYSAFSAFAAELCLSVPAALLGSSSRTLGSFVRGTDTALFAPSAAEAKSAVASLSRYRKPDLAVVNSFAVTEGFAEGLPFVELGFPSYGHHCLFEEPYFGYAGARVLAARMLNALQAGLPAPRFRERGF